MIKVHTIPLHIGDLLAGTLDMDTTEFGAHMLLIIAHYQSGEDGLAYCDKKLARIARVSSKVWNRIREKALDGFHMQPDLAGGNNVRWVHDRCLKAIRDIDLKSTKNRTNALKRYDRDLANVERLPCSRKAIHYP